MLQRLIAFTMIALLLVPASPAQQPAKSPATVRVRKNTVLKLLLVQPLDPRTANVGDDIPLLLPRALVVDGITVLYDGQVVHGKVTRVKRPSSGCASGGIKWKVDTIVFSDSSTAKTKVWYFHESPDFPVPERFTDKDKGNFDSPAAWVMLAPVIAIAAPFAAFYALSGKDMCLGGESRNHLPVNSTVAIRVLQDHPVHY